MKIPYIPEDAPFNADQRAWLSGFLAGLHSRLAIETPAVAAAAAPAKAASLHILYGTQTGNAERVAMDAAAIARSLGLAPEVAGLDDIGMAELAAMQRLIVVTSTYGEGEMPDNAQLFWEALSAAAAPRLEGLRFGVLALGDTGYDGFCQAGKLIDMRLEQLGATRILARRDCDIDYEDPAAAWVGEALPLAAATADSDGIAVMAQPLVPTREVTSWNRKNPYPARLAVNRRLSGSASGKEIRHYEFDLGDSGLTYEAGDALGVMPINDPALVHLLLSRLGADPQALVGDMPLETLLTTKVEISTPSRDLIAEVERRAGNEELTHVLRNGDKEALDAFLWGKDICDLVALAPEGTFEPTEFTALLKPLQHRAYSISSSPQAATGSVHLTIASVRYHADGRDRGGVCSTFLANRVAQDGTAGIFVSQNKSFRLPADNDAPVIMVGPGTGIAPFRAFLQEAPHPWCEGPQLAVLRRPAPRKRFHLRGRTRGDEPRRAIDETRPRLLPRPAGKDLRADPHAGEWQGALRLAGGRCVLLRLRRCQPHGARRGQRACRHHRHPWRHDGRPRDRLHRRPEAGKALSSRRLLNSAGGRRKLAEAFAKPVGKQLLLMRQPFGPPRRRAPEIGRIGEGFLAAGEDPVACAKRVAQLETRRRGITQDADVVQAGVPGFVLPGKPHIQHFDLEALAGFQVALSSLCRYRVSSAVMRSRFASLRKSRSRYRSGWTKATLTAASAMVVVSIRLWWPLQGTSRHTWIFSLIGMVA
jgi:sulfite reductase (NADPH) flavoprotein alpha-component